jgi:hypothetical protein
VDVFPAVETHPPWHLYGNRRLQLQFERAPDDGHDVARNMLSSIYATKQSILQLIVASGWVFYLNIRCNIFIGVRITKEMPGSVAIGTFCRIPLHGPSRFRYHLC